MLAKDINPIEVRRAEQRKRAAGRTFGEVANRLHEARKGSWKNKKFEMQWLTSLEHYCRPIWGKPVETIGTDDVLAILQPIWTAKAETASRTRGRIEAVLDAARARDLIPKDRANPARWRGHLSHLLPKRQKLQRGHHAALPYAEVAAFVRELRERDAMAAALPRIRDPDRRPIERGDARALVRVRPRCKLWVVPRERMKAQSRAPRPAVGSLQSRFCESWSR